MQPTADNTRPPFDFSKLKARWAREQAETSAESSRLRDQVSREVPPILRRYGVGRAYLFGSIAEGRAHARSDVDLLVMDVPAAIYWDLRHDLEQALGRPLDLLTQDDDPVLVGKIIARGELIDGPHP
ncbi:nucleotidyltransferase family protein [Candidatus Thiodictyon syntrophicum]|jgi:predicted nucleotidyltransferase|uniref:DNA polymerase beta n=1 Tax=Candidatus Thiodictyon syntrophicum TaxID=1166950 RepID=A0A2K8U482_9GAMM|nr:nucleotidyltransferase domain-containing protein [Candidatus Thiodictyon syntrophicum]AUB80345.1 DNA polymerase beta [Candidatus Thiodictyon syntrophicum]